MHFKHVAVVGVGLIGGSFALAARRAGLCDRITGSDRADILAAARGRGVIDDAEDAVDSGAIGDADLVYLAAPVGAILGFLRTRVHLLGPGTIVTDAGSTKREICRVAREALPDNIAFVGGHPMAGSEKAGVEFADPHLFSGAPYAVIAGVAGNSDGARLVTEIVSAIGATPIPLTAEQHDHIAARISHAPQILSTALALAVARNDRREAVALSGSGFAEMTRLAQSRWSVWEDICRTNADEITSALDEALVEIEALRAAISSGDSSGLKEMFCEAGDLMRRLHELRRKTDRVSSSQ